MFEISDHFSSYCCYYCDYSRCVVQVHLLCLLSHTLQRNQICNEPVLQAVALSLLPSARISPETWRVSTLSDYVYWFRHTVDIDTTLTEHTSDMVCVLCSSISNHGLFMLTSHWHRMFSCCLYLLIPPMRRWRFCFVQDNKVMSRFWWYLSEELGMAQENIYWIFVAIQMLLWILAHPVLFTVGS